MLTMPCNLQPKDFSEDLILYTTVPIHLISMEICFIFKMVKLQVYHRIIQKCISYCFLSVNAIYIPILHSYVIGALQTVLGEAAEQEQFDGPAVQHVYQAAGPALNKGQGPRGAQIVGT